MAEYKISAALAEDLTHFIYKSTGYHAIVCNQEATIVGDSDGGKRVGTKHEGSEKILSGDLNEYVITAEAVANNPTLKEGQNYPIEVDGIRVGTFALAGKLECVRPLAKVVVALLSSRLKQARQMELVQEVAQAVFTQVGKVVAAIKEISGSSQEMAANTESVVTISQDSAKKVQDTGKILDMSRSIATQTKLLSLNASIEAARAGLYGRGFAVVAQEMQKLAQNSADATENIDVILKEIQRSIQGVIEGIQESAAISGKQTQGMDEIINIVEEVRRLSTQLLAAFEKK